MTKELSFGALADRLIEDEHLEELSKLKPGDTRHVGELRVSTARGYERLTMSVSRAVVRGVVDDVKTECSEDELPLDPEFASHVEVAKSMSSVNEWVFPSPVTGRPYEPCTIQQKHLRVAGEKLGLQSVGWHTFRHSYRSLLDATGAPKGVQQKLMRRAQMSTTMNRYGNALMDAKRDANSKVVNVLLAKAD